MRAPMRRTILLAPVTTALLLAACAGQASPSSTTGGSSGTAPSSSATAVTEAPTPSLRPAPSAAPGLARLEPGDGTYFGMNLDWANDSVAAASERLGVTPAVWVQFVRFPLDDADTANLDAFIEQVEGVGGIGLITLEPHDGLASVTPEAADKLAGLLADYWTGSGVPTLVRFAHEMNGSWYPWAQQPAGYVTAFETVAAAVHENAPASAMIWAPNEGGGYPFTGGQYAARAGTDEFAALDTNEDGKLDGQDDPYAPYYPGDEAVDWVGMSLYHWGNSYPWGENELPPSGKFAALLTGEPIVEHAESGSVPDFYTTYADGHDKPLAIIETAALYDPAASPGPTEAELKTAWFTQVFSAETREAFPRIRMINWFEWRKEEAEVGRVIDWRLSADADLARSLLAGVPDAWLRFAGDD
jgi:hypothetical protein